MSDRIELERNYWDETVSYGEFVKLRNQVGAVLPKEDTP